MSQAKAALKAISAAIKAEKYDEVVQQAQKIQASDPQNYVASIFLGFALSKLDKIADAEKSYKTASNIKKSDPQAWQGLIQLYERQSGEKIEEYHFAALKLAEIYRDLDEKYKCHDVVDKYLAFVKKHGTRLQYRDAQSIVLPTSPVYDYLEGRLPHPAHTYQIIAQITEFEENERINKAIGERRTRLGAKIGQVTLEVKREVLGASDLEDLYSKVIDWSNDDEIRRQYEERLFQRCLDTMLVLAPGEEKGRKRAKTLKLATDMTIIKHPYKAAWDIALEWKDPESIQALDASIIREYMALFPTTGLAQVMRGFMSSEISPFPPLPPSVEEAPAAPATDDSDDDDDDGGGVALNGPLSAEDRLAIMIEGMADAPKSILAHRMMGEYYQFLEEYESLVELMRNGRRLIAEEVSRTDLKFEHASESITSLLGTGLVYYQSPKNHPEAKALFEEVLRRNPKSTPALIGTGLVYEEEEDYPSAIACLERALLRDPANVRVRAEAAWVKALNEDYAQGKTELEACLPDIESKDVRSRDLLAQTQYRIGVCLWNLNPSRAARKDRSGAYSYFLAALKTNLNLAPAYTSLGIYYADYSKDKKRARKCFQKAFELSASEVEAAERLARILADQGEWELVELVTQRVIDSGKIKPAPGSKRKGISWPFAALGVAELNRQDYARSIVSFQSAVRITPNDYHSWVGLGESYHNSGRYIAATRAFQQAEKFEHEVEQNKSGETWFAKYMLANVKRELGDYGEAIEGYRSVLTTHPNDFGVSIALVQTLVESAWDGIEKGLFGQAAQRASETIDAALDISENRVDAFNLWRAVGDACSIFSSVQSRLPSFPIANLQKLLMIKKEAETYSTFVEVDGVNVDNTFANAATSDEEHDVRELKQCLHTAILCHKRAVDVSAHDAHAQAVAYYNLGWAEYRAHRCLPYDSNKRSTKYLKAAVRCFKRAIELEAGNSEFWNALGVVTSEVNPRVAQHSFVRSLFLNERSAQAWTNLGALYILQNDIDLARDAFVRAQSSDPDFAHAWAGQGIIALLMDDRKDANLLFAHAIEISESSSVLIKRLYSQSTFDQMLSPTNSSSVIDLVQPLFALHQLRSMAPNDLVYRHLSSLFSERIHDVQATSQDLSQICSTVEADYEVSESASSLSKFALAKADLARSQLAVGLFEEAIESGETALQLSAEDAGNELSTESRQKCRLSSHLTIALAHYFTSNMKAALEYFQPALEESNGDPNVVCVLSQVLWAKGDEECRNKAREILFNIIESYSDHVQSVLLLGVIGLLDRDEETLEAVAATLHDLRSTHSTSAEGQARIGEILRAIACLGKDGGDHAVLAEIQTDVLLHPDRPPGWSRLAAATGDGATAEMACKAALKSVPPRGKLEADDLAIVFAGTGKMGDAQRAVIMAPWNRDGWVAWADMQV